MVEENFKIGIELELEQDSLANITKQVEKAVKQAFDKAAARTAGGGGSGAAPPPVKGGTATTRSAREAVSASSADFTNVVTQLARSNRISSSRFDDAAAGVVQSLERLTKALERRSAGGDAAPTTGTATSKLVANQVGPTNKNLGRDVVKSRTEAGRQTTGSGGTSEKRTDLRTGTKKDSPTSQTAAKERQAARSGAKPTHPLQRHAQTQAKAVASSLDRLGKEISSLGKLGEIPDLLKKIGLPTGAAVGVGEGASVEIKTMSGQTKTVTSSLRIVGRELTEFTNVVSKRINDLMGAPDFQSTMQKAERTARKGPKGEERAVSMIRRELKSLLDLPSIQQGGAQAFEKAGEATLQMEFSPELRERLKALKDESQQIALVNKELWEMSEVLKELRKQGGQVIGSVGLGEEEAAKAKIIKGDEGVPIGVEMPVQLRDLAGMGLGGRGAMRAARSFQPHQAREMVGGEIPPIMGKGEAEAYETGAFKEKMTRTLRTAYADPAQLPEVHEDMILLDKKAAESMGTWEPKITQAMKELAEGIQAGGELIQGQVMGYDIEGEEIKFDMKGVKAEVEAIKPVVVAGIKGYRLKLKELYPMITGSKMTTGAGHKGVVRVEEDIVGKYGLPEGTEAAVSSVGAAKRGVLSDPMKMMASEMARAASEMADVHIDPQEVANVIEDAMRNGGKGLVEAIGMAAEQFGVEVPAAGQGKNIRAMMGDVSFLRMKEPKTPGPADIGTRYIDKPAVESLKGRAGTAKMANDMMARMDAVSEKQKEYIATIKAVTGASDVASESLRRMLPEEFRKLPSQEGTMEDFTGTMLDPELQREAAAIRMPERGGGERLFRMPALGPGVGERGGFKTDLGAMGPDAPTRQLDAIMQQGRKIREAEGRVSPDLGEVGEESETYKDAAYKTAEAIRVQVKEIEDMGFKTKEAGAAAAKFVKDFMPLIESLKLTEGMGYFKLDKEGGRTTTKPLGAAGKGTSAEEYVKGVKGDRQQMLRMQDVLKGRAATKTGKTENVPTGGEVFKNAELLQKVMAKLGVTLEQDADAVEKLYSRLEKLEEKFLSTLAMAGVATPGGGKPGSERKRPIAGQMGAGLGVGHKELTAIGMRTDISDELAYLEKNLDSMSEETVQAAARMKKAQGEVASIPRDVVFLNKKDWDNLIKATMKEKGIGREDAESRLQRPGLLHRFPTTGGASFLAAKARPDPTGTLEPGTIGVAGPAAVSSKEDLERIQGSLKQFQASLEETIIAEKGVGPAAEAAKSELIKLSPVIQKLNQLFIAVGLNLDHDGDKISWLGDMSEMASAGMETFTQRIEKGGTSFQQMMLNMLGRVKGGETGNVQEYGELLSKVRKVGPASDLLAPETGEMAAAEAQAHIGGKKSVGLLTDMFNKMELAVLSGAGGVGDAFSTWIEIIMLNINKSLAQKSGGAGVAGPVEFIEDLKAGKLEKISKGMESGGEGLYGEMGDLNKQMRQQMKEQFTTSFLTGGPEALRGVAKAEGVEDALPKDLTFENFKGAVDSMVNALDLKSVIKRMFDMMKKNMVSALSAQGKDMPEINTIIKKMLTSVKGKTPGLDPDIILGQTAPGYLATRQKQVKEMRDPELTTPMGQGREMLQLLGKLLSKGVAAAPDRGEFEGLTTEKGLKERPDFGGLEKRGGETLDFLAKHIAQEADLMIDEFNLEDEFDPRAAAKELAGRLKNFYEEAKEGFTTVGRQADFVGVLGDKYTKKQVKGVAGAYVPGGEGGAEGEIFISAARRIKPLLRAIKKLNEIAGGASASAEEMRQLAIDIKQFGATVSHEKVHQANKKWKEALDGIVTSLKSGGTALGSEADKVVNALAGKANIAKLKTTVDRLKQIEKVSGAPQITPERQAAEEKLYKATGEELLAYQTDPEQFKKTMKDAGVSSEAIQQLNDAFMMLVTQASTLEEELVGEAAYTRKASTEVTSLAKALDGMGVITSGVKEDIKSLGSIMGGKFTGSLQSVNEKLSAQEAAVREGSGVLKLPRLGAKGGKIEIMEEVGKTGFEDKFQLLSERIKGVIEAAKDGFPDASILRTAESEIGAAANDLRSVVSGLEKTDETVSKGAGQKAFQKVWQEFHQAVSVSYINKARQLQRAIGELRAEGEEVDPGRLRDLLAELNQVVEEHQEYLGRSLKVRGRGTGTVASHIATPRGELGPAAQEAGITPGPDMLAAQMAGIAGPGKEGAKYTQQMGQALEFAVEEIKKGRDMTVAWSAIFEALKEDPKLMHTNLAKVAEQLAKIARHTGFAGGQFGDASLSLMEMSKHAKALERTLSGKTINSAEDLSQVLAGGSKQAKQAVAAGTEGKGTLADSVKEQYKEAVRVGEEWKKRLQSLIDDPEAYKTAGKPKTFKTKTVDIIDPDTGDVFQKIEMSAKRMGKTIEVSMKNASNASSQLGTQMRSSLRRVVQWGFASGVVYGLVRAFRNAVQVITEVQDKMMALQKVMDTSITDFGAMQDAAVGMAQEFGVAIADVLDGMVVYGQQGLKMSKILERTEATMLAVNVTTLSATDATEALTAAHKVFGSSVSSSSEFVDAWGAVAAKHAITAKDLADAVKRSGAAAGVAGVGFEDFMGIVTAIGAVTRQTGKEIATSTKFMFRSMRRPTAQKELGKLGIKSLAVGTGDLRPAMDILSDVAGTWDDLTRAQQINLAQAMAGIRHYNSFIVLMKNFDEAVLASIDAQNSQGFATRKNALAMQTFSKQIKVLQETVKKMALELGKSILPIATGIVKGMSGVIGIINHLPGPLLTAGTAFAALGLAGMKAADLIVDSMDAIFGGGIGEKVKGAGMFKAIGIAGKQAGKGLKAGAIGGAVPGDIGRVGKVTSKVSSSVLSLGTGITNLGISITSLKWPQYIPGVKKWSAAMRGAGAAARFFAGATGIGLIILALGGLVWAYNKFTKTGKELAKEFEDQIGKSQDYAMALKSMNKHLLRTTLSFKKVQSSMEDMGDVEGMQEALNAKNFKSAAVAAQTFGDTMAEAANAIAKIDPEKITGIDEFGNYVVSLTGEFKNLTTSAIDAQNSITAALQTKVLTAFAKDIKEPLGFMDKMASAFGKGFEAITFGAVEAPDLSPYGKLVDVEKEIKKLVEERNEAAANGIIFRADGELRILNLVQERAALEEQVLATSMEIKKVMEAMPAFEDMGMAVTMMGPDMAKAIESAIPSGVFGRGATVSSVMQKNLAKSAGTGGLFDYRAAATPAAMAGGLLERGILPESGAGATGIEAMGEIAVLGPKVAAALVESMKTGFTGAKLSEVTRAAQVLQSAVSRETGEDVWRFWDNIDGVWRKVTPEAAASIVDGVQGSLDQQKKGLVAVFQKFSKESMEEAAEETERILNLSFVGALAGTRMPKGGMPDLGAARNIELSPEQRAIKAIALDMERLGEIQNEMNQITKEYSETVLTDVQGAYAGQAKSGQALKALTADMVTLVSQLQEEAFNLAVIGHYQVAIEKLGLSMDQAAESARDARIEEEARAEYLVETSGALAGLSAIPSIDFGKTFKELGSAEKLVLEVPGFKSLLDSFNRANRERETMVQHLAEIRKQRANFDSIVSDLEAAGENLTGAQGEKILERAAKGLGMDTIESIKVMEEGNKQTQDILKNQVDIEVQMLESLRDLVKLGAGADPKEILKGLEKTETKEGVTKMLSAFGAAGGGVKSVTLETLGIRLDPTAEDPRYERVKAGPSFYDEMKEGPKTDFDALQGDMIEVLNAGVRMAKSTGGEYVPGMMEVAEQETGENRAFFNQGEIQEAQKELRDQLFGMADVAGALSKNIIRRVRKPRKEDEDRDIKGHEETIAEQKAKIQQKQIEANRKFRNAELEVIAGIEKSTKELMAKDPARLAVAARDFATSLDDMITGFKKAEALAYTKIDSALEGPSARVGKPGFKTEFEKRREELKGGAGRPMSMDQMRSRDEEKKKLRFDIKESKITQKQDIETKALREQQSQAEQFRGVIADALFGGQLKDTGLEGDAKRIMETLTDELAASEQAYMRGGELFYKGVPSLEEATRLAAKAKEVAKGKAAEALGTGYKTYITDPLLTPLNKLVELNRTIAAAAGASGAPGVAALPPGAVKGIAAVGGTGAAAGGRGAAASVKFAGISEARKYQDPAAYSKMEEYTRKDRATGKPETAERIVKDWDAYAKDHFVQEQTFSVGKRGAAPGMGPVGPDRDTLSRIEAASPATMSMTPGQRMGGGIQKLVGMDIASQKEGVGPIDLNESMRMLQTSKGTGFKGGRTNYNLEQDRAARKMGDASATGGGNLEGDKPTSGSRRDIEDREAAGRTAPDAARATAEGNEEVKSAIETLCGKVEQIIATIAGIGDIGTKVDAATAAVTDLGDGGLDVNIDEVTIANASEIGDAVNVGLGDLGSAVSEGSTRLAALETIVGDEDIDTRIENVVTTRGEEIATATTVQVEEARADAIAAAEVAAAEQAVAQVIRIEAQIDELQTVRSTLENTQGEQELLITQINNSIELARRDLEDATGKADDALSKAESTQENVNSIKESVDDAVAAAEEAQTASQNAEAAANGASEVASEVSTKADQLDVKIQQECVARENADRDIESETQKTVVKNQSQDSEIKQLKKVSARADENSKRALAGIRRI